MGKKVFLRCSKIYIERDREREGEIIKLYFQHMALAATKISQSIKLEFDEK